MDIYIPFTYIIGWSKHKKFYYGAKFAQGCHPDNLWESYFTSSKYVSDFREEYGEPDIIKIHRIFKDKYSCILFEHEYLTKINAKNNTLFLNKSNGGKYFAALNQEIELKKKQTCLEKYDVECVLQVKEFRQKGKQTNLIKYGVDNPSKLPEIIKKVKETKKRKYGNENYNNREKAKQTCLELYEVDNPNKSTEIKEKRKTTNLVHYNCENVFQNQKIKNKSKQTCLEKYGVDNISKSPENKKLKSQTAKLQRANEPILICPHCGLSGKGPNMKRYHFNNCKKKK